MIFRHVFKSLLIHLWLLPATLLVQLFYIVPLKLMGYIYYEGNIELNGFPPVPVYQVNEFKDGWYTKLWRDWAGWAGPLVILTKDPIYYKKNQNNITAYSLTTTIKHEYRHCQQWAWFGCFFPLVYFLASIYIFVFTKNKHAYLDNPFEKDARKYAGQKVDIPKELWLHGPEDRWPWW